METQIIIILLLFALRTVSAQVMNIPPPPTLPSLDISSLPEYMQRLLANRPSVIYVDKPNNHEVGNGNGNILHDHLNHQIPGENIDTPKTNGVNPISNQGYSLNRINNVKSEPLVPHALRKPHTYGMHLRGDKGVIWNHVSGSHMYVDFAPSKSIHPNSLHNKEVEPNHPATNNDKFAIREQNNHHKQELPSVSTVKPEFLETTSQIIPEKGHAIIEAPEDKNINNSYHSSISNLKSDFLYYTTPQSLSQGIPDNVEVQRDKNANYNYGSHQSSPSFSSPKPVTLYYTTPQSLSEEIPDNVKVQKDKNVSHNNDSHQNIPSISTSKPDTLYYTSPQPLSEEVPAIVDYQGSVVNSKENINSVEIPKKSIENTIPKDKIEQSFGTTIGSYKENKIYQSLKTYGMNLTGDHGYVWNDLTKPGIHYNVGELETSDTTNPITEEEMNAFEKLRRRKEDPPFNNMIPELDDLLKKEIEKFVKKEVARQLEKAINKIDTDRNNGSENNNGGDVEAKKDEANNDSKNGHNNYGSIIGNGKITNVFVFYPNDKNMKSIVNDTSILNKPVNEILNDMLNKGTNKKPDRDESKKGEPTESPDMMITAGPNQQNSIFTNPINMGVAKYKESENTSQTTEATTKIDVTTVEIAPKDQDNQTIQNATAEDDAIKTNTDENTTIASIGSSIDDESTTAKESNAEDIKTEATMTESSSTDPSNNSSMQEIDSNNETTSQATTLSNEAIELTAEKSNNTNDSANPSTDESNKIEDQPSNESQAAPNMNNEDAELTSISTNAEDATAAIPDDNVTSEGTVKENPSEDLTTEATAAEAPEQ